MQHMQHSAVIRLQNARRRLELAREECPHWDMEEDSDDTHDCCYEVREAKRELRAARDAAAAQEKVWKK